MAIQRYQIADYIKPAGGMGFVLMGTGFNTLDENPSAQMDTKVYINDKSATSTIKSYQTQFPFDSDLILEEEAVMDLYLVGRDQKTGAEAQREYIRVELFRPLQYADETNVPNTFLARKFNVAVEVSSFAGGGGETITVSGNLNSIGDFVDGYFDVATRTFTEGLMPPEKD